MCSKNTFVNAFEPQFINTVYQHLTPFATRYTFNCVTMGDPRISLYYAEEDVLLFIASIYFIIIDHCYW